MPFTGKVTAYTENSGNGLGRAQIEIEDDANPGNVIATILVQDTIANMDARIREDIVKAVQQLRTEVDTVPAKDTYSVADDDTVT